jgi:segregation and condensation protein B
MSDPQETDPAPAPVADPPSDAGVEHDTTLEAGPPVKDGSATEPAAAEPASVEPASTEPTSVEPASAEPAPSFSASDEPTPRLDIAQLKAIIEALVFASPEPLTTKMLYKLLSDEPREDVLAAIKGLQEDYQQRGGLHLVEVAGGYQITTRPELHDWVRRLFHERTTQKLTAQSLETLAVIAYQQPVTAAEIGEIRGVNTSGVLTTLMERHLIKIVGRKNVINRPFLYGTTKEFLIRFGLKDLNDLPKVEDMAAALGFEAPAILTERPVTEDMLPLEEDDEGNPHEGHEEHEE